MSATFRSLKRFRNRKIVKLQCFRAQLRVRKMTLHNDNTELSHEAYLESILKHYDDQKKDKRDDAGVHIVFSLGRAVWLSDLVDHPHIIHQIQALAQILHLRYGLMVERLQEQINLSPRESEVLELLSFGKSNPEIAIILNLSTNTVTGYVSRIFLKLGVSDRVSAAMRAVALKPIA